MLIMPSIVYTGGGEFLATTAAISYGGYDYNMGVDGEEGMLPDAKYCFFIGSVGGLNIACVGTKSATMYNEPQIVPLDGDIYGGEGNLDAILVPLVVSTDPLFVFRATIYCPSGATSCVVETITSEVAPGHTPPDLVIFNVFTAMGTTSDYVLNDVTDISNYRSVDGYGTIIPYTGGGSLAGLWGGDGAGGERAMFRYSGGDGGGGDE